MSEAPAVIEERELPLATLRRAVLDHVGARWSLAETEATADDVELAEALAARVDPSPAPRAPRRAPPARAERDPSAQTVQGLCRARWVCAMAYWLGGVHRWGGCAQVRREGVLWGGREREGRGVTADARMYRRPLLLAAGYTDQELTRKRRLGELTRVRRGSYLAGPEPDGAHARHRLQVRAAMGELARGAVVSHASAAVLHRLPAWGLPLHQVTVTRPRRSGGRRDELVHMRTAPLADYEIVMVDGLPTTSVARTVVDLARAARFESGLVTADAALALGAVTAADLQRVLARCSGWPGSPRARRVVAFADPRSGSVGESRSRVAIATAGLPEPVLQWEVRARDRRLVGRTDFGWPDHRLVGEFDGRVKYGRLVPDGDTPGDVVFAEKRREDDLRAQGLMVVRWTWNDLTNFAPTAARLHHTLARR